MILHELLGAGLIAKRHQLVSHRPVNIAADDVKGFEAIDEFEAVIVGNKDMGDFRNGFGWIVLGEIKI
mgnify:CR=1 FL=1